MRDSGSELKNKLRVSASVSKSWGGSQFPICLSATSYDKTYDKIQFALFWQVVWVREWLAVHRVIRESGR